MVFRINPEDVERLRPSCGLNEIKRAARSIAYKEFLMRRHRSIICVAATALLTFGGIGAVSAQMRMGAPAEPPQMMRDMMNQDCPMAGMMASG